MNTIQNVPTASASSTHPLILVAAAAVTIASGVVVAHMAGWLPQSAPTGQTAPTAPAVVATAAVPAVPVPPVEAAPVATAPVAAKPAAPPKVAKPVTHAPQKVGSDETAPYPMSRLPPPPPRAQAAMASANVPPPGSAPTAYSVSSPMSAASIPPDYAPPPPPAPAICRDCGTVESISEVAVEGKGSPVGAIAGGLVGGIIGNQFGSGGSRTATRLLGAAGGAYIGNQVEKNNNKSVRYNMVVRFEDGTTRHFSTATIPSWRVGDRVKLQDGQLFSRG